MGKGKKPDPAAVPEPSEARGPRPVAVVDIGTTSMRLAIAQIRGEGDIDLLETLHQSINLGRDAFTRGAIEPQTIEDCVEALKSFRRVMLEYQIEAPEQIRAVATSAVREASNRDTFLDRLYIATGIEVEAVEEAEVSRLTYLSIEPLLHEEKSLARGDTVVLEVGGGSTELIHLHHAKVVFSHTYRLGAFRMRQMLESFRAPISGRRAIMENHIERTLDQMRHNVAWKKTPTLLALGGDARFAAGQLAPNWKPGGLARLKVEDLETLTRTILADSVDELVLKHHITYPAAESLGPALLTYLMIAHAFGVKELMVSSVTMREGVLAEMSRSESWNALLQEQILESSLELGRRYQLNEAHARRVEALSLKLFHELQPEHRLPARYEFILQVAALLHEIGLFISIKNHHLHSMYLILHSELFGFGPRDIRLVALIARYHRGGSPRSSHPYYGTLDREDRIIVSKLAAILRVADALERTHSQRIDDIHCSREDGTLVIHVPRAEDLTVERMALSEKGSLFAEVYGLSVVLRNQPFET